MAVSVRAVAIFLTLLIVAVMMSGCDDAKKKKDENTHVATKDTHEPPAAESAKAAAKERFHAAEQAAKKKAEAIEKAARETALQKKRAARFAAAQRDRDEARDEAVEMRAEEQAEDREKHAEGLAANLRTRVNVDMPVASAIVDNAALLAIACFAAFVGLIMAMLWRGAQANSRVVIPESLLG